MIDPPDHRNPHPRPLLPSHLGRWEPYSVPTIHTPLLQIEGYFEPAYIEISACTSIYLSLDDRRKLDGIFDSGGEDREEVYLGKKAERRAVRLMGIRCYSFPGGDMAFLQVKIIRDAIYLFLANGNIGFEPKMALGCLRYLTYTNMISLTLKNMNQSKAYGGGN